MKFVDGKFTFLREGMFSLLIKNLRGLTAFVFLWLEILFCTCEVNSIGY